MQTRRFVDCQQLFADGAGAEEEDHDEGVWETDFGSVDGAIADGFDQGERGVVFGIEDYALCGCLGRVRIACAM